MRILKESVQLSLSDLPGTVSVDGELLKGCIQKTNTYLQLITAKCNELDIKIFESLGQRNISGFIGEVFANTVAQKHQFLMRNPHPDGRPDLIGCGISEIDAYFKTCFRLDKNSRDLSPIKQMFSPFKYGGVEVKTTIGSHNEKTKKAYLKKYGTSDFQMGLSRIEFIRTLQFWGHHTSCNSLFGLYYDYDEELNGIPQIKALFYTMLSSDEDWGKLSVGHENSKKTSNTSLTATGRAKILENPVLVTEETIYLNKFRQIGIPC